jgi:hypothetical protein
VLYRGLADAVVILHLAFVAFVVLGALPVFRWPRLIWVHLPAAAWGSYVEFSGRICPLTPLENWLRQQAGDDVYETGFVEQYLTPALYPAELNPDIQFLLGGLVVLVNTALYGLIWRRHRRASSHQTRGAGT